ncbi:MAG TPA: sigma 54-interacting transcriptional regulator [Gemmataceae bacterium]|jgi:PAS domain S-box-containing protein|nr:sigma 54-interacting transcriptional regulator [Gemmataceae bacterium]
MPEKNTPPLSSNEKPARSEFRWQAFFQRASEPLFLLSRQRRILFVNRAWEELTGVSAAEARGVACTRRHRTESDSSWSRALYPPREVLHGKTASVRRVIIGPGSSRGYWDIDFFPLQDADGPLLVVGKIKPLSEADSAALTSIPENLLNRRHQLAESYRLEQLDGVSPLLRRVREQVRLACQTLAPVLIVGEPGAGKRHVARIIHHQGIQTEKGFAALDCGGLSEPAFRAALWGESGLLRRTKLGTLYLAEPSRLPRDLQSRLAEALGEPPTDGSKLPRLIAGFCRSPEEEVKAGLLTEELLAVLGTLVIHLPAIRDRSPEIPDLANQVLKQLRTDGNSPTANLTPAALEILQVYSWPGNSRELRQVLSAALNHHQGDRIDAPDLPAYVRLAVKMGLATAENSERSLPLDTLLEQAERRLILHALKLAAGNKTRSSEILSIWRPRLLRRMEALGIEDPEK